MRRLPIEGASNVIQRTNLSAVVLILLLGAGASGVEKVVTVAPRIDHVTFHSAALDREMAFSVVLPDGYTAAREGWPMLVILHGRGRNERTLIEDEKAKAIL